MNFKSILSSVVNEESSAECFVDGNRYVMKYGGFQLFVQHYRDWKIEAGHGSIVNTEELKMLREDWNGYHQPHMEEVIIFGKDVIFPKINKTIPMKLLVSDWKLIEEESN